MADQPEQPDRRHERGKREHDRQHRRQQRPERDQQNAQRQRHGSPLGVLEVLAERVVEPVVRRRVAELTHRDPRMRRTNPSNRVKHRLHAVGGGLLVAGHVELDQRAMPVRRDHRRRIRITQALRQLGALYRREDVTHRRVELRRIHVLRRTVDQHHLAGRLRDMRVIEDLQRYRRVPGALLRVRQMLLPGRAPDHRRQHDKQQPAEHCRLAVTRTPAAQRGGHVALSPSLNRMLHGSSPVLWDSKLRRRPPAPTSN